MLRPKAFAPVASEARAPRYVGQLPHHTARQAATRSRPRPLATFFVVQNQMPRLAPLRPHTVGSCAPKTHLGMGIHASPPTRKNLSGSAEPLAFRKRCGFSLQHWALLLPLKVGCGCGCVHARTHKAKLLLLHFTPFPLAFSVPAQELSGQSCPSATLLHTVLFHAPQKRRTRCREKAATDSVPDGSGSLMQGEHLAPFFSLGKRLIEFGGRG